MVILILLVILQGERRERQLPTNDVNAAPAHEYLSNHRDDDRSVAAGALDPRGLKFGAALGLKALARIACSTVRD